MPTKRFQALIIKDDGTSGCGIELPFNPKDVYGKVRAPVVATIKRHAYRTTTCAMGGAYWIPLNKTNRTAAGVEPGQRITVSLELDETPRSIKPPPDLAKALKADPAAAEAWKALSFSHQREHAEAVESAKKPETRIRRAAKAVEAIKSAARKKPKR